MPNAIHRALPDRAPLRRGIWPVCGLLAGLLTACGGGGNEAAEVSSQKAEAVKAGAQAAFAAPPEQDVFDLGASVPVSLTLQAGTGAIPDGMAVDFSATSGSFAPPVAALQGGGAGTTFTPTGLGRQTLSASVPLSDGAVTASRTLYVRPAAAPMEVLVPAYFYPSEGSPWDAMTAGAAAYPSVTVTAILNPNNGVFTRANPEFTTAATAFVRAGGKLLGYVYTGYGSRSISKVKGNIDKYLSLYGTGLVSGLFIDEMSSAPGRITYYRQLFDYIKSKGATLRVVGNPGTVPNAAYAAVADTLVTFENRNAAFADYDPRASGGWLYQMANTRQNALVHDAADCAAMQAAVRSAATARVNSGVVYVTDDTFDPDTQEGNPWDTLPPYWTRLLGTVDSVNRGATLPTC
ncbi:spherulation-specific family 4 protein [Acidovorax sp. NCPPB 3576]|uniref:spherulation-specific family 4 protein n=1 Tax=Acidovorax sp. NCPPB 3576 TaxID=2940488 RepID=UPI00234A9F0A|nr:spherulation-specific family 4 protein [Acidovorax sp. NCPPB 3576]WCM89407.1 spherulation-specific family 4 protein [Acidovorax sp. NCPPB 3576]